MTFPITDVTILEDADDARIADWLEQRLARALNHTDGPIAIALPGGSTPFPILERLVQRDLDWSRVMAYPTDDRIVPEDHPASNTGKLRALLEPVGVAVTALPVPGGETMSFESARIPDFRLVWLGMGADGHIASLFPNTNPQIEDGIALRRLTPDPLPPAAPFDRVTLTLRALLQSDEFLFVARGDDKRAVLDGALKGEHDLPITRLLAARNRDHLRPVTFFV